MGGADRSLYEIDKIICSRADIVRDKESNVILKKGRQTDGK